MKNLRISLVILFLSTGLQNCSVGTSSGADPEPDWATGVAGDYKGTFAGSSTVQTVTISRANNKLINMAINGGAPAQNIDMPTATTMSRVLSTADSPSFAGYTLSGTFSAKVLNMNYKDTSGKVAYSFSGSK